MAIFDLNDLMKDSDATGEVREGQEGWVVRRNPKTGGRPMDKLEWGLLPFGTEHALSFPRPTHARAETVAELPVFADAFRRRRALIVASDYTVRSTKGGKSRRHLISRADGKPMGWAGIWESFVWPDGRVQRTFAVITVDANTVVAPYRERMPLVVEAGDWDLWLGDVDGDPMTLLRPVEDHVLQCIPVIGGKAKKDV